MGEQTLGVRPHLGLLVTSNVYSYSKDCLIFCGGRAVRCIPAQAIRIVDKLVLLHLHAVEPAPPDGLFFPTVKLEQMGQQFLHAKAFSLFTCRPLIGDLREDSSARACRRSLSVCGFLSTSGISRSVPPARFRHRSAAAKARPPALRLSGSPVRCNRGSVSGSANLQACRRPAQSTNAGRTPWTRRPKRRRLAAGPGIDVPRTSANRRARRPSLTGARCDRGRRRPGHGGDRQLPARRRRTYP